MKVSLSVICYKSKKLKNDEYPLMLRITKEGIRKYKSLGISVKLQHWDFNKNKPKPSCPDRVYIEQIISDNIREVRSEIIELQAEGKEFTADSLIDKINSQRKLYTIGELFLSHIKYMEDSGRYSYALSIKQVYNSLYQFNKHLNISFAEVDVLWLKRYENWLKGRGLSNNTIGIRFRTLRTVYNLAIEEGLVKEEYYPFKKYKVSKFNQNTPKRAITKEEIMRIISYKTEDTKSIYKSLAVDIFAFSYYMGGINFVDIAYLTGENIISNKLIYIRKKTTKQISLPIPEKAWDIIRKYYIESKNYIFPILSLDHVTDQQKRNRIHKTITKINSALISIGEEVKIPIKLTTYVARHSFATVLKRSGVNTSIISELMGHSSEMVTKVYLDSFDNEQIKDVLNMLM